MAGKRTYTFVGTFRLHFEKPSKIRSMSNQNEKNPRIIYCDIIHFEKLVYY